MRGMMVRRFRLILLKVIVVVDFCFIFCERKKKDFELKCLFCVCWK